MQTLIAQEKEKSNFGLRAPQDPNTVPKSKSKTIDKALRVGPEVKSVTKVSEENEIIIQDNWTLIEEEKLRHTGFDISTADYNDDDWYTATVPGTVLTTLVNEGVYPDPYFGVYNTSIPEDLCRKNWWYRTTFSVPQTQGNSEKKYLILNGINYRAIVWVNGTKVGRLDGAFVTGKFDITALVQDNNTIAVQVLPPPNPGIPQEAHLADRGVNGGQLCMDGPTFISSEGWDWIPGIRDRNIGIWQDVRVRFEGGVSIENPFVVTDLDLPDLSKAKVNITSSFQNKSKDAKEVIVEAKIENKVVSKSFKIEGNSTEEIALSAEEFKELNFKNPRLWWPNGYGKPELYTLELSVKDKAGKQLDNKVIKFGIRELSFGLTVDAGEKQNARIEYNPLSDNTKDTYFLNNRKPRKVQPGVFVPSIAEGYSLDQFKKGEDAQLSPYLVIKVNGVKIFVKGGNWGMDDGMKRVSRERLEPYMKLHQDAHFNLIRNWTGESTEEEFYALCDEYGMMVWNDFWLSTQNHNLLPNDEVLFMNNAKEVVLKYRNHPSIVVWCPRNEGYAPESLETKLSTLVTKYDGTRFYQGNSRNLNLKSSGPWKYVKDPTYYADHKVGGFSSELGTTSIPTAESMRKMMAEEDLWPINDVWAYHDFHWGQEDYVDHLNELYGDATGIDDFCKKAQFINYNSHRNMFESWNSKLWNNTTGLLLWMTHPAWPSTVWQVYSWDYETFGSYYASKKGSEPIHIQRNVQNQQIEIANASQTALTKAVASVDVFDVYGKKLASDSYKVNVPKNQLTVVTTTDLAKNIDTIYLIRLTLRDKAKNIISINEYWEKSEEENFEVMNTLASVKLNVKELTANSKSRKFKISNTSNVPALNVKLNALSAATGEVILPAYFSDGYFALLPGESRIIDLDKLNLTEEIKIRVTGYNVSEGNVSPVF